MNPLQEQYFEGTEIKDSRDALEDAKKNGWKVVFPEDNQLQLDIDDDASYQVWSRARNLIEKHLKINKVVETPSKSGQIGKWHITVDLGVSLTPEERIMLQALLGSDRMRETLSYIRFRHSDNQPTLFYEKLA